jgi:hypothetical protein
MALKKLADVRELLRHPPADHRERLIWRQVAAALARAVADAGVVDVFVTLRIALRTEGAECRNSVAGALPV